MLVDTNLWVTYLLPSSAPNRPITRLLQLIQEGAVVLLVPDDLLEELEDTVARKPSLSRRILVEDVRALIDALRTVGEAVVYGSEPPPRVTRDPKVDYLIATALEGDADFLLSGDADLLALRDHLDRPRIMTVRELVDAFEPE